MPLENHLSDCETDTRRIVSGQAANALSRWRACQTQGERVQFVKKLIRSRPGMRNGWEINYNDGVSLEKIVLDLEPELFDQNDKGIAARTLGRS